MATSPITSYPTAQSRVLDYLFGNTIPPSVTTLYLGLYGSSPTAEITGSGYSRVSIPNTMTGDPRGWEPTDMGIKILGDSIPDPFVPFYGPAGDAWGVVGGMMIFDTSGNLLFTWPFTDPVSPYSPTPLTVNIGDSVQIDSNNPVLTF